MYISTTGSLKRVIGSISTYVNAVIFILLYCIYHTLIATRTENNGILQNSLLKNQNICYTQFNMMLYQHTCIFKHKIIQIEKERSSVF